MIIERASTSASIFLQQGFLDDFIFFNVFAHQVRLNLN